MKIATSWIIIFSLGAGLAAWCSAQETIRGTSEQVEQRAVIDFSDLAQRETAAPATVATPLSLRQAHPRMRKPVAQPWGAAVLAAPALPKLAQAPQLASPPPSVTFTGVVDNGTAIPPDTMGAVGPNHVVTMLNSQVRTQDRTGGIMRTVNLNSFWAAVGGAPDTFDPRIAYDPLGQRWIASAAANGNLASSVVLVGVSATSDPTGKWYLYRVRTDVAGSLWADFDALGFNGKWIVVTANLFDQSGNAQGVVVYAFDKANLYANGAGTFTKMTANTDGAFSLAPAQTFDSTLDTLYLVDTYDGTQGKLRISSVTGAVGAEVLNFGSVFPTSASTWADTGAHDNLGPQLGAGKGIDLGDSTVLSCQYRNGSLWLAQNVFLPVSTGARCAAQWWQLDPGGTVQQFGRIDDATGATMFAYPSLAANASNDVLIGYSRFTATQYISADYAFRFNYDPLNTLRADTVFKTGEGPYVATDDNGLNRWGDFSATVVDPLNNLSFWTIQEYAAPPHRLPPTDGTGKWSTYWAKVDPLATTDALSLIRPAAGMLFPAPATVTLVATQTDTSVTFSSVEFFAGTTSLGLVTSPPFTVTWNAATNGTFAVQAIGTDTLGHRLATLPIHVIIGSRTSPLGTWQTYLSGLHAGNGYVTFADDFTYSGYAMRLGLFGGLGAISGTWNTDKVHRIVGPFTATGPGTNLYTGNLVATAVSQRLVSGRITPDSLPLGYLTFTGLPVGTIPDLTGTWLVTVRSRFDVTNETWQLSAATAPGVFTLTGQGTNSTYFLAGQAILGSANRLNLAITTAPQRSLAGTAIVNTRLAQLTLHGTDDHNTALTITAKRQ